MKVQMDTNTVEIKQIWMLTKKAFTYNYSWTPIGQWQMFFSH